MPPIPLTFKLELPVGGPPRKLGLDTLVGLDIPATVNGWPYVLCEECEWVNEGRVLVSWEGLEYVELYMVSTKREGLLELLCFCRGPLGRQCGLKLGTKKEKEYKEGILQQRGTRNAFDKRACSIK